MYSSALHWTLYIAAIVIGLALMLLGIYLARGRAVIVEIVLVLLLLAAFAVYGPGLFTDPGRSIEKRTMADIRTVGIALETRETDTHDYPTVRSFDELVPLLEPTYLKNVPRVDGWGNAWKYESWKDESGASHYALGSPGRDKKFDHPSLRMYSKQKTTDLDADTVFRDGEFIVSP